MGGGYYDRYLAGREHSTPLRLGLGYECQRDDRLQTLQDSWDIALDALVSDRGFYRFSSRSLSS
jgi:5-formyltetrahydrofolate cyclo-ligase